MKNIRIVIVGVVCAALIVGYYYYISHNTRTSSSNTRELTEVEKVLTKDLDENYPKTPCAVVKMYDRIICCYYDEECDETQIRGLAQQAQQLMDAELIAKNPIDDYLKQLKTDIVEYRTNDRVIQNATVEDSSDVEYRTVNGDKCAYVEVRYFIKEGKADFSRTHQMFVLRQDKQGRWKILGFDKIKKEEDE